MMTQLNDDQLKELVVWMFDKSVDTDIDSQAHTHRKQLLDGQGLKHVQESAAIEGIELSSQHLGVVECLRDYYLELGEARSGRDLEDMLNETFTGHGGRKYLWQLFPGGPVTQGLRLAGLPIPPHCGDRGFGTVR